MKTQLVTEPNKKKVRKTCFLEAFLLYETAMDAKYCSTHTLPIASQSSLSLCIEKVLCCQVELMKVKKIENFPLA